MINRDNKKPLFLNANRNMRQVSLIASRYRWISRSYNIQFLYYCFLSFEIQLSLSFAMGIQSWNPRRFSMTFLRLQPLSSTDSGRISHQNWIQQTLQTQQQRRRRQQVVVCHSRKRNSQNSEDINDNMHVDNDTNERKSVDTLRLLKNNN